MPQGPRDYDEGFLGNMSVREKSGGEQIREKEIDNQSHLLLVFSI